jgi:DNA (cytosine-5)-methyltransferase 1
VATPDGGDASAEGLQRSGEHGQQPADSGSGRVGQATSYGREQSADYLCAREFVASGASEIERMGAAEGRGFAVRRSAQRHSGRPALAGEPSGMGAADDSRCDGRDAGGVEGLPSRPITRIAVPGVTRGFWGDAEWIHCRPEPGYPEGRWRPVEAGTFPLAHGIANRVGKLRGYGNALVAPQAEGFVRAFIEFCKQKAA